MEQLDAFTQKRFELIIEMATKKLQQEIVSLKEQFNSVHLELGSLKSQMNRIQFAPAPQAHSVAQAHSSEEPLHAVVEPGVKKDVKIIDCRPEDQKKEEFVSGAARNSEPIRPRFGDYKPEDVSINKFFYFGRK